MPLHREERHADAVLTRRGQLEPELRALAREKLVRDLNQDAGAIAGFRIAAAGSAVRQVDQYLNSLSNDFVAFMTADAGHKAHAARVMLMARIVQPLCLRKAVRAR